MVKNKKINAQDLSEHQCQCSIFEWARLNARYRAELNLLYAIPNGGKRDRWTGAMLKREGVKSGMPDMCLPVGNNKFNALYIELKVGKNKLTKNQIYRIGILNKSGNLAKVCYGYDEAVQAITAYLDNGNEISGSIM